MQFKARAVEYPVTLYEVLGIARPYRLFLPETAEELVPLADEVPFTYEIVEGNYLRGETYQGILTKLSVKAAEIRLERPAPILSDLRMQFVGTDGQDVPGALYAKVVGAEPESTGASSIRFTSSSPEIETFFASCLAK